MAELAFGTIGLLGTIDLCIRWGNNLDQACKDYQKANDTLVEMYLRIRICWSRVLAQLEVTKELESTMTDEHKDVQQQTLCILRVKLDAAIQNISKVDKHPSSKRGKLHFVRLKDTLEETIRELESWQKLYEPFWLFLIKLAPSNVDGMLNNVIDNGPTAAKESTMVARKFRRAFKETSAESRRVFIKAQGLKGYDSKNIPYSTAKVATCLGGPKRLIIDVVTDKAVEKKDARDFARRLRDSDPFTFGIFSCKGVVQQAENFNMAFLFRVPEGYTAIRSVRQLLVSGQAHDSLSDRLEMAKRLVSSIYYVHLYGFVHKNIRPETILSLSKPDEGKLPSMTCLVGFQVIRNADGRTYPVTDLRWETNLYRHPQRHGNKTDYYVMQHDIYSLGVCLLEIGLWESFITYDSDGTAQPSRALGLSADRAELENPRMLQKHLINLSRSSALRARIGTKYSEVVETCLTCLDEGNLDFGDEREFQDEDGVAVDSRYIEKILGILHGISL
ncbi:hypothetical protein V8C42DRAFT_315439 [Trichoderma barbatum]